MHIKQEYIHLLYKALQDFQVDNQEADVVQTQATNDQQQSIMGNVHIVNT